MQVEVRGQLPWESVLSCHRIPGLNSDHHRRAQSPLPTELSHQAFSDVLVSVTDGRPHQGVWLYPVDTVTVGCLVHSLGTCVKTAPYFENRIH